MRDWITAEPHLQRASKLRIRVSADRYSVWTRFACLADFRTFREAADYIRKACCFGMKDPQC